MYLYLYEIGWRIGRLALISLLVFALLVSLVSSRLPLDRRLKLITSKVGVRDRGGEGEGATKPVTGRIMSENPMGCVRWCAHTSNNRDRELISLSCASFFCVLAFSGIYGIRIYICTFLYRASGNLDRMERGRERERGNYWPGFVYVYVYRLANLFLYGSIRRFNYACV